MLISKQSLLSTNNRNYKKYKELGYTFNIGDKILVDIEHLNKSSRSIVNAKCDVCGVEREITYSVYYCNTEKYNIYTCVGKCSNIKYKMTNLEKFGVEYPLQNKKINNDLSNYFIYKYDKHPSKLEEIENKKRATNRERYGVDQQMYLKENIDKIKKTKLDKYGDEKYNNIEKTKKTKLEKYGDEKYNNIEKTKKTKLDKYGDEYYNNIEKNKSTVFNRYGVENVLQLESIKNKIKLNNIDKYGFEFYQNTDEYREKYTKTCFDRYGVFNPMQDLYFFEKQQSIAFKCKEYEGLFYRGTYELDFIKFCIENNLEIKKASKIKYKNIDGLDSYYFPDFYLPNFNLIIEIKSSYYFKLEESKNIYKKNASINSGYNFLFIIDKDYKELKKIINN